MTPLARRLAPLLTAALLLIPACRGKSSSSNAPAPRAPAAQAAGAGYPMEEVAAGAGIDFRHFTGATGEKHLPETIGSGVCAFDLDRDGWTDLYFVNGAPLPPAKGALSSPPVNHLYRNRGDGTFQDITASSGTGDPGYGLGCAVGDFDGDGWPDLYVANFGRNVLYRNRGDGTFQDVTASSGTGDPSFSSGATFVDIDSDGDLDLYVVNYMEISLTHAKYCGELKPGYRSYCGPEIYPGQSDRLYRNDGNGRFTDISAEAGIANADGHGLGVLAFDYDLDGDQDIYVANDGMANFLYKNDGRGHFTEEAFLAGVALSDEGEAQAGMGADSGDYDGDGLPDLFVSNITFEPSALYRNNGDGTFTDRSYAAGLASPTHLMTGYGTGFFDFDNDGWLDLFQANGNMMDNVELYFDNVAYKEPAQLFRNRGDGTFEDLTAGQETGLSSPCVGRGSAFLDFDGDGRLDLALVAAGDRARLFRNRDDTGSHWLQVTLVGTSSNRSGFGAKVYLEAGGRRLYRESHASSGFGSQSEPGVHFGLGSASRVDRLEVSWPSGRTDRVPPPAVDRRVEIVEGSGRAVGITRER